jgi:hypothetical protein
MPSHEARLKRLEKKAVKVEGALKKLKDDAKTKATKAAIGDVEADVKKLIKWVKLEVKWSEEVTKMLRLIDWDALATAYPGGSGTNPPATPPDWPPPESS